MPELGTTGTCIVTRSPESKPMSRETKFPAAKSPLIWTPPSSARSTAPPRGISIGSNSLTVSSAPVSVENVWDSCWSLLASVATKVPEPDALDTTTAPSTSTTPLTSLAPAAGV